MKKSLEEKRASARFPYIRPVSYRAMGDVARQPDVVDVHGEILDLSNNGAKIYIKGKSPEVGTVLRVWIPVAIPNVKVNVPVLSQVRWVREIQPKDHQVGIQFIV